MNWIKGKNNKMKIGDRVEMANEQVKFYAENVNDLYLVSGDKEILAKDYASVASFYHAFITGILPKGKVVGYGANDSGPKSKGSQKWVDFKDKKTVKVVFKLKYCEYSGFFSERYLRKI